jgi:hypothetical protein
MEGWTEGSGRHIITDDLRWASGTYIETLRSQAA